MKAGTELVTYKKRIRAFDKAPRRKNGDFDRRYKAGRAAHEAEMKYIEIIGHVWRSGN